MPSRWLVLLLLPSQLADALLVGSSRTHLSNACRLRPVGPCSVRPSRTWQHSMFRDDESCSESTNDDDEPEDEEDEGTTPYGNRSLAWTNRYRRLLPYTHARALVMSLGLRSKNDWDDHWSGGDIHLGPYVPSRPEEMYADDWVSWDEFLGVMREYDETRQIVQSVLCLRNMDEYRSFVQADVKRAEGLRIPYKPEVVYRERGWVDEEHFFGVHEQADRL